MSMKNDISTVLQDLISNNSELGSRLLSLLLVNSENGKEIINAINNGNDVKDIDLKLFKNLDKVDNIKKENREKISIMLPTPTPTPLRETYTNNIHNDTTIEEASKLLKRKRNTEASARFRKRRREREIEKLNKLQSLQTQINEFNDKINSLVDENDYWKLKLKKINESKSNELLESIKRRNMQKNDFI